MSSTLIGPNRQTPPRAKMNQQQREFAEAYLANGMNGSAAAREAGYAYPHIAAVRLLKSKPIKQYIEWRKTQIQGEFDIKREHLLNIMKRVLTFNTMKIGKKSQDGFIEIDADEYNRVAEEIGDLVVETEVKTVETEDKEGNKKSRSVVRIKLMSKDKMFELALKYKGMLTSDGPGVNVFPPGSVIINFDDLCAPPQGHDVVEGRIAGVIEENE